MPSTKKTKKEKPEEKVSKYVVSGVAIVALVVVAWLDLRTTETVSNFVYGGLVGAILGADVIDKWIKR